MSWYFGALKKYATFSGRARRKEYWMFLLVNVFVLIIAQVLDNFLGTSLKIQGMKIGYGYISLVYSLLVIIPGLALVIRRLHDVDKSGAWIFITLIPLIGSIWLLVLMCTAGTAGTNRYGSDPKY